MSIPLNIIFDDEDLVVVEKPPGMHSVALDSRDGNSVAEHLLVRYPEQLSVAEKEGDAGLIQRLDFDTNGLLIAARNQPTWEKLREMLLAGEISKRYLAIIDGLPTSRHRTVHTLLGSRHRGSKKVSVAPLERSPLPRMLEAHTVFSLLSTNQQFNVSLVEARAPVARRHQIRAHAAHIGHPLTGDVLYGSQQLLADIGIQERSYFLLAHEIAFRHPRSGKSLRFTCLIPRELLSLFPNCSTDGSVS